METFQITMRLGEDGQLNITQSGNLQPQTVFYGLEMFKQNLMNMVLRTGHAPINENLSFDARLKQK